MSEQLCSCIRWADVDVWFVLHGRPASLVEFLGW